MSARTGTTVYTIVAAALLALLLVTPGPGSATYAQVGLPPVQNPLNRPLDRSLDRVDRLGKRVQREVDEVEEKVEEPAVENATENAADTAATVVDEAGQTVQDASGMALDAADSTIRQATEIPAGIAANLLRPFVLDADPAGWPIEKHVVVLLLDETELAALMQGGTDVLMRRELPALGLTLATVSDPTRQALQIRNDLRQAHPAIAIDFNHVYRFAAETAPDSVGAAAAVAGDEPVTGSAPLRVGMIDSAVLGDHPSLQDSRVVSRDFVAHEGTRPLGHGTAVASLIAGSAANEAEIHAASAFFQTPGYAPGATSESLVAALDWLVSQQVDVVNMSLAGPANELLEKALGRMAGTGPVVVAAVGNNGPSGEPLFPAAYEGVIGVTAVDREHRVFRYANRGDHVDYAALGVNVRVADSGGSWRLESGTSMASPHVAVVVARTLQAESMAMEALMDTLTASAEDLGARGFDRIFGYGLVTEPPLLLSRQ